MSTRCDVLVIGAGAAGLMSAFTAGRRGRQVLAIDHANKVGKKILMSGGGRCNFTNTGTTPGNFISANRHFCKSALARYSPADFVQMVERHGIAYHEKELGQLFCDVSSKQIVRMLLDECETAGVEIRTQCEVQSVRRDSDGFNVETSQGRVQAQSLIVATGGLSIPRMGASDFGYTLAKQLGHDLLPTRAGLVPLTLSGKHQERFRELAGLALPVEAQCNGVSFRNFMLLTHRGVSGPAILQISSYWQPGDDLRLDLLPGYDAGVWLREQKQLRGATELRNVLAEVLPRRFAQRLCEVWLPDKPVRRLDPPQLQSAADLLGAFPLIASGTEGYRTAEVTLGGVDAHQVSSATMESRLVAGLYFVGEVLDVTGWLGGYNFQWAWASGHAAGTVA
ncbi:NAD(P)/FAD-dependent oxidoreductase [Xanthomonas fragariae]|uniref:NAD(P)/FAD-dependent oxidoreductase n=1 Tax=Xanthomonas fragariae TaxID=48664 RepID=UPI0022AAA986|nr:NAD(P)/FAD-dependent oxidoreductase [Xanthomonas fragariae]WAT16106.1 NAD(P)/FAD-dependent oxidoreductase [Xanthomonas fragariae]